MRGKMDMQVNHLFNDSGIFTPGESKHDMKEDLRSDMAADGQKTTWHDFGQNLTICSYKTAENYKDVWHQCANWAKDNMGMKNLENFNGDIGSKWLETKIDQGVSLNTFRQYASAIEKLGVALEMYNGKEYDLKLDDVRSLGNEKLEMPEGTRAYDNPAAIVDALSGRSELIASLQYTGGFRISEVATLQAENLKGDNIVGIDNTKGGKYREIQLSPQLYSKLESYLEENNGRFCPAGPGEVERVGTEFREDLKIAAAATGQAYTGSHGLRWNYAQETYSSLIAGEDGKAPMTPEQSLKETSMRMGHMRSDVTLHYTR